MAERHFQDRERRRLGSVTAYGGPTHSGKSKKIEAELERAQRQGRQAQVFTTPLAAVALVEQLDPATELVLVDDAQRWGPELTTALESLATQGRIDVVVAGWELDFRGEPQWPMPEIMCKADAVSKLDDGVCAQPGCRNPASRTQRFIAATGEERFAPVCRRHHERDGRTAAFQEGWFEEPAGSLEVITGCMFSGKTQELIRRLDQERYAGAAIQAFKAALDDRYAIEAVASHRQLRFPAIAVPDATSLEAQLLPETRVIGIDEAQFFGPEVVHLAESLADRGLHVIAAGLDLDFMGRPFGPMPELVARADRLAKLQAACQFPGCGSHQASRTQRLVEGTPAPPDAPLLVVGGAATYQARCRHHHEIGPRSFSASGLPQHAAAHQS